VQYGDEVRKKTHNNLLSAGADHIYPIIIVY